MQFCGRETCSLLFTCISHCLLWLSIFHPSPFTRWLSVWKRWTLHSLNVIGRGDGCPVRYLSSDSLLGMVIARVKLIMCLLFHPVELAWKNMFCNTSVTQCFRVNLQKNTEKSVGYIWRLSINPLLLHPLSRTRAAKQWHSDSEVVERLTFFERLFPFSREALKMTFEK